MITFGKFYNGVGLSKYLTNAFDNLTNCDVHTEIGSVRSQLALASESVTANKPCYSAVATNGDTYFFSKTDGAIFKRTQAGVYSSVRTNSNGLHKSAIYYNGYIYYTTDTKLGRFDLSSTWTDSYQTLTSGDHPMEVLDLILYIGNDNDVAQLDETSTWNASGLDLPVQYDITALKQAGGDNLLVGATDGYGNSRIFNWDTYNDSWFSSDPIPENRINTFLMADNIVFFQAGDSGNIYRYYNSRAEQYIRLRDFDTTELNHQLSCSYKGRLLIANGDTIYSLHRTSSELPFALCGEYTATGIIHSVNVSGDDLLVSYNNSGTYGVDNVTANYATATIRTPLYRRHKRIQVSYNSLPADTSISIKTKIDDGSFTTAAVEKDSEDKNIYRLKDDMNINNSGQAEITLNPHTTSTPIIDKITIL